MSNTKQVIVMRKDLKVRKGKYCSQAAHASIASLLKLFYKETIVDDKDNHYTRLSVEFGKDSILEDWLGGVFTKITVYVESEEELIEIFDKALEANLPCALITDAGLTEFHGVPTTTCCCIGPYLSEEIDKITGDLPLL